MKTIILRVGILAVLLLFSACATKSPLEQKPALQQKPSQETQVNEKTTSGRWELEWKKTMLEAKKEGRVVIASGRGPEIRTPVGEAFQKKYGIVVEWLAGGDSELSAKLFTERRAGIYATDLFITGGNTTISRFKPGGVLSPLPPAFILPEVKDLSAWWDGKLPFLDKNNNLIFSMSLYPQHPLQYNTKMVKRDELSSYQGLLNPKWKGKIVIQDPLITGGMLKWFSVMTEEAFGPILGFDYVKKLVEQEPVIMRDRRLVAQWILQGKYPISMNMQLDTVFAEFERQGIPVSVESTTPGEGGYLTTGGNNIVLIDRAPHPNSARLFINWLLSKEGQILWSRAGVKHSTRIDIPPPEEIEPLIIKREMGLKYVNADTEELLLKTDKYIERAREIFAPLLK